MKAIRFALVLAGTILLLTAAATSQVPSVIPFQGVIKDASGAIIGADTPVEFSIWDAESAGTSLWGPESHTVTPQNGIVSVFLGGSATTPVPIDPATVFSGGDRYLEITVDGTTLTTRLRMGSTPYAFTSSSVVDNAITASKIAAGAVGNTDLANDAVTSIKVQDGSLSSADLTVPFAYHRNGATVAIGTTWTQYGTSQVSLTVPGPGYIIVDTMVWIKFSHTTGTQDAVQLGNSTSATAAPTVYNSVYEEVPSSYPTDTNIDTTREIHSVHPVSSAGTYTYYLVGQMWSGQNTGDTFWFAEMSAQYIYDPTPLAMGPGDDVPAEKLPGRME